MNNELLIYEEAGIQAQYNILTNRVIITSNFSLVSSRLSIPVVSFMQMMYCLWGGYNYSYTPFVKTLFNVARYRDVNEMIEIKFVQESESFTVQYFFVHFVNMREAILKIIKSGQINSLAVPYELTESWKDKSSIGKINEL